MAHYIGGEWVEGEGPEFHSFDPATGETVWSGREATDKEVEAAIQTARKAFGGWFSRRVTERVEIIKSFETLLKESHEPLATTISRETGKPLWETKGEVAGCIGKVDLTIASLDSRLATERQSLGEVEGAVNYRPLGVIAILGPFNFPAHLPNGQILPALLAGNTVVVKPSELTPLVAERIVELWDKADLPPGVLNLVQGGAVAGRALSASDGIDGLLFTGSYETGCAIHRSFGGHPEKLLALEMGGNNPLIAWEEEAVAEAVSITLLSAFMTSGQRCTCARRVIVPKGEAGERFLKALVKGARQIKIGAYTERPEPFMGPLISPEAAERALKAKFELIALGASELLEMKPAGRSGAFVTPGILDVTEVGQLPDREVFAPLAQVIRVNSFEEAIAVANRTRYGLSAGLISGDRDHYDQFCSTVRAGVKSWNRPMTGASGRLPFGGAGASGNHRPGGFHMIDACAYPVASQESEEVSFQKLPPGLGPVAE